MKTHLNCAILATGLMIVGEAVVLGQTITANIPFDFRLANTEMPAGEYSVKHQAGSPALVLSNWRVGKTAMALATPLPPSGEARTRLIFQCGENGCELAEVWGATSSAGVQLLSPHRKPRSGVRLTVVYGRNEAGN